MVGEPLAAGELNRPYVGESERILVALCTRCHRIPYAMCCISIDEVDSLAPKRDEDSSEGKVDKISALLSLIEGIKDVSNLMILCTTNRLHMMDEAFLRRIEALIIADHTVQRYQIFFGSETLPRLFLRNSSSKLQKHIQELSNHIDYTGRIVIDLYDGYVRIEIRTRNENDDNCLSIVEQELNLNEVNVQLLQLIDLNLLASQGAYDEKKVFETLKDRYDECSAYTRSMIVYDLDALVGVNKFESDSNMDRSTSSSVVNASIYTYVRARFRDCAIKEKQEIDRIERWAVAIIHEPFLLRQFFSDIQFVRTSEEEDELDLEHHKSEVQLKCVKCKDFYIENENKMVKSNCIHHDGFIYDNSSADLTRYRSSDGNIYKWRFRERYATGRADRLEQATIIKWEEACLYNQEYNEKWLGLLSRRLEENN